ncbi:MAG: hypothetical protein IIA67_10375, partial [Planctomycetes bacterium]|nr:hypothetical protein [Planctomycetota bacterium]
VAGTEAEEPGQLVVERRLAVGGLITRPTLAMLGERGPELVVPISRTAGLGGLGEPQVVEQHFHTHINVEGAISPDVLDDVIEQISDRVRNSNIALQASSSFDVTSKS